MNWFLAKTDPTEYSIDNLQTDKKTEWDGVRNPQAVIFLKQMRDGDKVLIYHSQGEGAIVGLAEVVGSGRADANNPRTWLVDFKFIKKFNKPYITIKDIKKVNKFPNFRLVRQSRLSTMDVPMEVVAWLKTRGLPI